MAIIKRNKDGSEYVLGSTYMGQTDPSLVKEDDATVNQNRLDAMNKFFSRASMMSDMNQKASSVLNDNKKAKAALNATAQLAILQMINKAFPKV